MALDRGQPLQPDTVLNVYCIRGDLQDVEIGGEGFLGNWQEDGYAFLFFRQPADGRIEALLAAERRLVLEDRFEISYRDWQGDFAGPLQIGRFLLSPPGLRRVPGDGEISLSFDPGLVFGDGRHPTTLACLTAIEIACAGGRVERMIDLGTGTGLLALAGASLGCRKVLAVDNNLLAASTAAANVRRNRLEGRVLVVNGLARDFAGLPADLLVANIGLPALRDILTQENLRQQRWLVLSGLQRQEAPEILAILAHLGAVVLKRWHGESIWNTVLAITAEGG